MICRSAALGGRRTSTPMLVRMLRSRVHTPCERIFHSSNAAAMWRRACGRVIPVTAVRCCWASSSLPLNLCETEMSHSVAGRADADEPPQALHLGGPVVLPPLVYLEPRLRLLVFREATYLALHSGPPCDHAAQSFPILGFDTEPDVGEPAGIGDEVDEQPVPERSVFARQDLRNVGGRSPPRQACHRSLGRIPALCSRVPLRTFGLR